MQLHNVTREHPLKKKRSVGRGGKRGKTSGRGTKGQRARAGRKIRPEIRDMIKRIPKLRGRGKNSFKSFQEKSVIVSLNAIEKAYTSGETVSPKTLIDKKIISLSAGSIPLVKILSDGELTKKITLIDCAYSLKAKEKIVKVGGAVSDVTKTVL